MCDDVIDSVISWGSDAADSIGSAVSGAARAIGDAAGAVGSAVSDGWSTVFDAAPSRSVDSLGSMGDAPMAGNWATSLGDAPMAGDWAVSDAVANAASSVPTAVSSPDTGDMGSWLDQIKKTPLGDAPMSGGLKDTSTMSKINWGDAGLKLGAQALGSLATANGSAGMKSYLDDVKDLESKAQKFNMNTATQKSALAGQLGADGLAINPANYAQNQLNATKNRDASAWAEQEARMRANGFDENAITAERNRAGLISSQNQGTAYDSGMQTGTSTRNSTVGTAGSLYTPVSQPSAGLSSAYSMVNNADTAAQKGWGNAIEQAFGLVNSTTKKPSA